MISFIVANIQKRWKERMIMSKAKLDLLSVYWDKERSIMIKYYYSKQKKNKKAKNMYNKLMQIDSYTKDYMIKHYFEKCKHEFTVAFFE
jgi:hypothetical protein